jgi:hypothetical protein
MVDTAETLEQTTPHLRGKVTFREPDGGWNAESYEQQLGEYVAVRGRAPQSVTMHPDTAHALGLAEGTIDPTLTSSIPFVVTSPDYDSDTITLYF